MRLKNKDLSCLSELEPEPFINNKSISDQRIKTFAYEYGIHLTPEQCGSLRLTQTIPSLLCAAWMQYYFSLVGDQVPNSDHEIHLEPIPKKEVYKEYVFDMEFLGDEPVTMETFYKIWKNVYPYVKVRKYKNSCGHCNLCTTLSDARRKFRDRSGREEVTNLFALHRISTMGERRTYYDRRLKAELSPQLFLSTIADGMQQNHCLLPWYGNSKHPGAYHVKQHLQGVYMHGDNMTVFRTFANVGGGGNLAIHTWLLSLENYWLRNQKRMPQVLYHQIDGGPENANGEFLALCALLVACRLVHQVVLTRLPVGHTHEDIDGLFALIWRMLRDEHVYSPSEFASMIVKALKKKVRVNVVDLFAIPDYTSMFEDCMDPDLGRFAKEEWAQLQFIFTAVDIDEEYPMGVKAEYRAYAQDTYIEIVEDDKDQSLCKLIPQECTVRTRPLPGEKPLNVLTKLPTGDFAPAPFIAQSRQLVDEVANRMSSHYAQSRPEVAREWVHWAKNVAPLTDESQDYVTTNHGVVPALCHDGGEYLLEEVESSGVYVPFKDRLFGSTGTAFHQVVARERGTRGQSRKGVTMRQVESTTCVLHAGSKNTEAKKTPSRVVTQEVDGTIPDGVVGVLNNVYPGRGERREATKKKRADKKSQKKEADAAAAAAAAAAPVNEDALGEVAAPKPSKKRKQSAKEEDAIPSDDSDEASDSDQSNSPVPEFAVDDACMNCRGLRGKITRVHADATYDVIYRDGRDDTKVPAKMLKTPPGIIDVSMIVSILTVDVCSHCAT
jgi:hypothetical protein